MNYARLALASLGGFFTYFVVGTGIFFLVPQMIEEGRKHSAIFRSREGQMAGMPVIMIATLVAIGVLAVLYAMLYRQGSGLANGARFGALIGLFVVSAFVVHNYVNLNISMSLALMQAGAHFLQWAAVGVVIGLIYKPSV